MRGWQNDFFLRTGSRDKVMSVGLVLPAGTPALPVTLVFCLPAVPVTSVRCVLIA